MLFSALKGGGLGTVSAVTLLSFERIIVGQM